MGKISVGLLLCWTAIKKSTHKVQWRDPITCITCVLYSSIDEGTNPSNSLQLTVIFHEPFGLLILVCCCICYEASVHPLNTQQSWWGWCVLLSLDQAQGGSRSKSPVPAIGVGSPGLISPGQHVALLFSLAQLVAESPSLGKQAPTPVVLFVCLFVCFAHLFACFW